VNPHWFGFYACFVSSISDQSGYRVLISIVDPDPGSGAFLTLGFWMEKTRSLDQEKTSRNKLTRIWFLIFGIKILEFFVADPDPMPL
jgi:hypothetical protein